jgi:transcriptional regulator with XRE-family HTH domain
MAGLPKAQLVKFSDTLTCLAQQNWLAVEQLDHSWGKVDPMPYPKLGENLKALRNRNGWTLQHVSRQTGVAVSTLSKVENDQMSLTYDKLLQISEGLGFSLAEFLSPEQHEPVGLARRSVNRKEDGLRQNTPNYDYLYLSTDITKKRMIPVLTRIRAKTLADFGPLIRHSGEEFIFILEGAIEVHTEHYQPIRLEAGESTYIDSSMGHAYLSVGDGDALVLGVCSSPHPNLQSTLLNLFAQAEHA